MTNVLANMKPVICGSRAVLIASRRANRESDGRTAA
jgi:hypothetical protein